MSGMTAPPGWYPDPGAAAGAAPGLRWWDGTQWTDHVQPAQTQQAQTQQAQTQQAQTQQAQPPPQGHESAQSFGSGSDYRQTPDYRQASGDGQASPYGQAPSYGQATAAPVPPAQPSPYGGYGATGAVVDGYGRATTPDGEVLAGWGARLGALIVDGIIQTLLGFLLGLPFWLQIFSAYGDYFQEAVDASEAGLPAPSQSGLLGDIAGPMAGAIAVSVLVSLVYYFGFLKWRAATPGKLMLGLRVRLRDTPGPLSWGTIGKRWIATSWPVFFSWIPVLGGLLGIYNIVDGLWPLWDDKKQALHDKFAGTNVVKVPPPG
jgi:uncharacterized RDD family membrane protein YckC